VQRRPRGQDDRARSGRDTSASFWSGVDRPCVKQDERVVASRLGEGLRGGMCFCRRRVLSTAHSAPGSPHDASAGCCARHAPDPSRPPARSRSFSSSTDPSDRHLSLPLGCTRGHPSRHRSRSAKCRSVRKPARRAKADRDDDDNRRHGRERTLTSSLPSRPPAPPPVSSHCSPKSATGPSSSSSINRSRPLSKTSQSSSRRPAKPSRPQAQ
jgi:hypothetical protein